MTDPDERVPTVKITEPGRTPLHLVVQHPIEVGRDGDGVLLADPLLSRRHLRLSALGGTVTVQDLGSTNGSKLDGAALIGPTELRAGQVVEFGACRIELVTPSPRATDPATDPSRRTSIDLVAAAVADEPIPAVLRAGGTLTIVFSDIEDSTRRNDELGDAAWMRLLNVHNTLIRRQVERSGGIEVKAQGDGFMLAFPSARSAARCCIEIQRALDRHASSHPLDELRVRIGMHTGEAIVEGGDLFGKPVVLAARIANQARGGEILVSSLVREILDSRGDLVFGKSRDVELKGLEGTHCLHPLDWRTRG
jgi:adenylate cyclase